MVKQELQPVPAHHKWEAKKHSQSSAELCHQGLQGVPEDLRTLGDGGAGQHQADEGGVEVGDVLGLSWEGVASIPTGSGTPSHADHILNIERAKLNVSCLKLYQLLKIF